MLWSFVLFLNCAFYVLCIKIKDLFSISLLRVPIFLPQHQKAFLLSQPTLLSSFTVMMSSYYLLYIECSHLCPPVSFLLESGTMKLNPQQAPLYVSIYCYHTLIVSCIFPVKYCNMDLISVQFKWMIFSCTSAISVQVMASCRVETRNCHNTRYQINK